MALGLVMAIAPLFGLRPGEKLYEEVLIEEKKSMATRFEKIFIASPLKVNYGEFSEKLSELLEAAKIVSCLQKMDIRPAGKNVSS